MTNTIEDIKGMNLQVGDMIEIKLKDEFTKEVYNELAYFKEFDVTSGTFEYENGSSFDSISVQKIKGIKVLEYKKQNSEEKLK